jgi:phosphoglycolate phosphatase
MSWHALVALDIDGTLIDLTGAGSRAMGRAFGELYGLAGPPPRAFAGSTDLAIVFAGIEAGTGQPPTARELAGFFACYLRWLAVEIARTPYSPTPGAGELVTALVHDPRVQVGLATGNVHEAAQLKLASAGLGWAEYRFGAFGEEEPDRAALVARAFERGAALLPIGATATRVVVGDTPRDIEAARAVGARAVAVATGPFGADELRAHRPDIVISSLPELPALDSWLGPLPGRGPTLDPAAAG